VRAAAGRTQQHAADTRSRRERIRRDRYDVCVRDRIDDPRERYELHVFIAPRDLWKQKKKASRDKDE
jgi:hypothetical protein